LTPTEDSPFLFHHLLRREDARKAAVLPYTRQKKKFKQAKERAAEVLKHNPLRRFALEASP